MNLPSQNLTLSRVYRTWWPLAASWLLMTVEIPALSAVIARLANPEYNLAAYGGIVFPIALIVESPIIMLISASTALCKDFRTYQKLYKFMMAAGAILTALHLLIALTPIYYFVARNLIGVPEAVVEPGRLGLILITPWTWSIAYRRFHQGVLIRFGYSRVVGAGTVVRLTAGGLVLLAGYLIGSIPGVAVGALAQAIGVLSEAVFVGLRVQPVIRNELVPAPAAENLSWRSFANFYIPLAMTSFIGLFWQPLGSAALSRMPDPLTSLAVWPVASGLANIFRSFGYAVNEAGVALMDLRGAYRAIRKFVFSLAASVTALQVVVLITPAAGFWFSKVSALSPELTGMAKTGFLLALPLAGLTVFQNWFQSTILNGKNTRAIPEGTAVFLSVFFVIAMIGIQTAAFPGLYVGMVGFVIANTAQAGWLWVRSRNAMINIQRRDAA